MQPIFRAYKLRMKKSACGDSLNQYSLLEDDRLVKSILPEGVEPELLRQPYEEWRRDAKFFRETKEIEAQVAEARRRYSNLAPRRLKSIDFLSDMQIFTGQAT
ncbi:hypothetical protein [[Eubacterium] cellulosolvens]